MKRILLTILYLILSAGSVWADAGHSTLPNTTTCDAADEVFITDDPAGTPTTKAIPCSNLKSQMLAGNADSATTLSDGDKGDVSASSGTISVDASAITYAKIQNVSATDRILGRDTAGAGVIEEITPANLRTMINVEDGATADQSQEEIEDLAGAFVANVTGTHTGITITYQDATNDMDFVVAVGSSEITDNDILEADFKVVDAPADEECLTYESTGGDFEWQACGTAGADSIGTSELDDGADTPGSGDYLRVDTVDQAGVEYRTTAEVLSDIAALGTAGGTLTGELTAAIAGIEFQETDTLTDCSSFAATGGGIFYDDSEGQFKKCQDNVLTDLDTSAGGGDAVSIDGVGVTDPDFVSTGDIDFVDTSNTVTANINAGVIIEPDLDADVAPVDGDYLQYDSTGTNFTWRDASEVLADIGALANVVEDTTPQLGGQLDHNANCIGDGTLEILCFGETGSAVNEVTITNQATGSGPTIAATGGDTNIDLNLSGKGTGVAKGVRESFCVAISDETTTITTGTAKLTMRMPYAFTLTDVRASLNTVSSSGIPTFDINEGGSTIMTTNKLTIDANEKTSTTAATAAGITDSALADDAEITFDVDVAGTGAKGAKICLIGHQ